MEAEIAYISMLTFMLQMKGMYFSNTYDLTVSQQRLSEFGPECRNMSLFERVRTRISCNFFMSVGYRLINRFNRFIG